ncbi:MAG: galactokinase [Deltaproteobacteria bacterium]|nr:MAG: galactokinase [Deltaproteobacteria bacterium]
MPSPKNYLSLLKNGEFDHQLAKMYGPSSQKDRYEQLLTLAGTSFQGNDTILVSAGGRTELGGNHTDHSRGQVLAAGIHLDHLAAAEKRQELVADIFSKGFDHIQVNLENLEPDSKEYGSPEAMVRGVAAGFAKRGWPICGFRACIDSAIPIGAGLSSSAALGVLICLIIKKLTGNHKISTLDIARIAKEAENLHFGKPCGFMDQIACAFNGVLHIDFADMENPVIQPLEFDFNQHGYQLTIVQTGGSHAGLTDKYAAVPVDMAAAAGSLGHKLPTAVSMPEIIENAAKIRGDAGDMAFLRLYHFIDENKRVREQVKALKNGNIKDFIKYMRASGNSSFKYLQNCSETLSTDQPIPAALAISEYLLQGRGACRVHGGGFAGTIQALVPLNEFAIYQKIMNNCFGDGAVVPIHIRPGGLEYF